MDEKRNPVFAGIGGAALAAALVAVGGGHSPKSSNETPANNAAVVQQSTEHPDITSNQEGPWYAFCQEYATTEFDHGDDPSQPRGIKGHQVPEEAEDGTAEITRNFYDKKAHRMEVEKFNVRKHTVGELKTCVPKDESLRVVVATVPDPNATQMRLDFDRDIVAIQQAAAAEHYLYTRYWFPWRGSDWTPDKSADPEAETRRRQEPGILCFRKQGDKKSEDEGTTDRLFVLLVGETPTSGANRIQLAHALSYGEELTGSRLNDPNPPGKSATPYIGISGPHFSASFKSIRDVLKKIKTEHLQAKQSYDDAKEHRSPLPAEPMHLQVANLISPDASGSQFISEFRSFCSNEMDLCQPRTLSLSSEEVRKGTLKFLARLGYDSKFVAQLSEDESAFGISLIGPDPMQSAPAETSIDQDPDDYGLKLHFPRDLSSARSLSDEESQKVAKAGSKYLSLPGGSLPTQLSASEPIDRDSPAAFGEEQEPAEVARSLAESVQEMRIHRIRAAVISASNPLDRIFLLEYLHNQLPDVRAVTIDADTLELDRPHFVDLTGTIAVTSMPLLSGMSNRIKQKSGIRARVPFASSRQEGEFLAVETLLDGNLKLDDSGPNENCLNISLVGGTGFRMVSTGYSGQQKLKFPCQVQQSEFNTTNLKTGMPAEYLTAREHPLAPRVFLSLIGFVLIFNGIHFWGLFAARKRIEGLFSYVGKMLPRLESRRLYLLFVMNNQVLVLDVLTSWLAYAYHLSVSERAHRDGVLEVLLVMIVLATAASTVISALLAVRLVNGARRGEHPSDMHGQAALAAGYLVCSIAMIFTLPISGAGEGVFLERMTHLGDALSPVMPIAAILLGYFLWGWVQLRRLDWSASRKAHLAFDPNLGGPLHTTIAALESSLDELTPVEPRVLKICGGIAAITGFVLRESLNGFEGKWFFYWFAFWGVFMLLLTVALTSVHAWSVWRRIRDLLTHLGGTSMSATFKNLTDRETMQVKVWDLAKTGKNFKVLQKTVESLQRLYGGPSPVAIEARQGLEDLREKDARHQQAAPGEIDLLSDALNVPMNAAVTSLYLNPASPSQRDDELQAYLGLRLVALIRYGMLHIGTLVRFVAYGFVLAVFSIMFYPFEGRKTIGELLVLSFIALLLWVGTMMVQFETNELLSHLEGSKPGEANYWQVVLHLLTVGALPLIAVLTSQFPGIANFAYSFLRPLLGVLH